MDSQTIDRRITELLDDPLISLMIRVDGVDRSHLAGQLRRLGRPDLQRRRRDNPPQRGSAKIFSAYCGACAP